MRLQQRPQRKQKLQLFPEMSPGHIHIKPSVFHAWSGEVQNHTQKDVIYWNITKM